MKKLHKMTAHEVKEANKVLEKVASKFGKETEEYKAIELAAKALLCAFQTGVAAEFASFLKSFDSELTDEQKKQLSRLGIEE